MPGPSHVEYAIDKSGKIVHATGISDDQIVFKRPYIYDEKGRNVEKSFFTEDGEKIKSLKYSYEE